eukprot:114556_1
MTEKKEDPKPESKPDEESEHDSDEAMSVGEQNGEKDPKSDENMTPNDANSVSDGEYEMSEQANLAQLKHDRMMQALEAKRLARTITVPTNDRLVKEKLRELLQPVCLFGEEAPDRRERLRLFLADLTAAGKSTDTQGASEIAPLVSEERKVYYTEGGEQLKEARWKFARMSLKRAAERIAKQKENRANPDIMERVKLNDVFRTLKEYTSQCSEIGDSRGLSACSFSPDCRTLATSSWSGLCKLWSFDGKCLGSFRGHAGRVSDIVFHPSAPANPASTSVAFMSAGIDRTVRLWSRAQRTPLATLKGHTERLCRLAALPGGEYVVSSSFDKTWRLWNIETQKNILTQDGHTSSVYALAAHPDGSLLLSGDLGAVVRIWDLRSGKAVMALPGHVGQVLAADFGPDGVQVATGAGDNTVKIWDLRRKEAKYTMAAHAKDVSAVKFQPSDGKFLVTASHDRTVKVWSGRDFKPLKTLLGHEDRVMDCAVSHDGSFFASASSDRTWKLWSNDDLMRQHESSAEN